MTKILEATNIAFDGVSYPYVPPARLNISPKLKLHNDWTPDVDPITYEVIRHNLWNINEEHGATIQRISGSPVAIYAIDLNPSILTEDAEFVYFGPYMQYMSGVTDTQVKWILEYRSDNPGIRDGDMFLANDPWVGAAHQMDAMLICPVFHEGELFCWVTNCLHQYDVGGITPSSFCPSARDAFDEGLLIPPIKIVENNEIRRDIEALYLRASRRPDMVALDFRAQMAGNTTAKARVLKLIERYGARTVKSVMKKVITNGERAYLAKMESLPDGIWRERVYVECAHAGDRNVYPVHISLQKRGSELIFENEGTAAQIGAMNCTYSGWRGSIMVVLNQLLCWEQYFAIGGALRHVKFNPTLGTLNCANYPASVSTAPIQAMEISLYPTYNVLSKMIYPDPALRADIMCMGGCSQWPGTLFQGIDQRGEKFGYGLIDPIGGAIGAFAVGDGVSTGGQSRTPISKLPNVEHTEQQFPILYLYRKELVDSGGAGKYRGGQGAQSCFIAWDTDQLTHDAIMSGAAIPSSLGLMGGYPAATNTYAYTLDTDIAARFARSDIPADIADVSGTPYVIQLREHGFKQTPNDVYAVSWCGGGGFGDPLDRDPDRIEADLDGLFVSAQAAHDTYGAVIDPHSGKVDRAATELRRARLRAERLQRLGIAAQRDAPRRSGIKLVESSLAVHLHRDGDGVYHCCAKCGFALGAAGENYKLQALREDLSVMAASPRIADPIVYIDNKVSFRHFYCPGCGTLLDTEIAADDVEPLRDIEIHV
ncbi:MAG: hydantoinase B/oxoprolinase family protein [Burkholderiaceae bacterium]|nr:hydantoinase B/oxoprolinase family protein [Burkholderiaceae bacterium]